MQRLKKIKKRKLLYEFFSPDESDSSIDYILSENKIDMLKKDDIKSIFILSSSGVDPVVFIRLINEFAKIGFDVKTHHTDNLDDEHLWTVKNQVEEIHSSLRSGGCLVISYGKSYALAIIGCLFINTGKSIEDAIDNLNQISRKTKLLEEDITFLYSFQRFINRFVAKNFEKTDSSIKDKRTEIVEFKDNEPDNTSSVMEAENTGTIDLTDIAEISENEDPNEKRIEKFQQFLTQEESVIDLPPVEKKDEIITGNADIKKDNEKLDIKKKEFKETSPFYSSIRFKLITIISLIIIISLNGMIFLATYFFKKDNVIRIQEKNHNISELIAHNVSTDLNSIITKSKFLISTALKEYPGENNENVDQLLIDDENILFTGLIDRSEDLSDFKFVNSIYNREIMDNNQLLEKDILDAFTTNKTVFKGVFHGDTIIHNISQLFESPVLGLSIPYEIDENRVIKSAIVIFVKLDKFLRIFKPIGLTNPLMLNDKGDVIAHPDSKVVKAGVNLMNLPIVKKMMESKIDNGQTKYTDENGVSYLGSFKKLGIGGAGVIATVKEELVLREVYNIQKRNLLLMIAVLSFTVLIIFIYGKNLTKPIIALLKATSLIKEGQYRVKIKPVSNDEIGQLTTSFIEMGKGLEEREKMKDAFGKFVNKEIAEQVLSGEIRLGGERKTAAVFFSDIRSFTAISEKMEPEDVVEFLNEYMTRMVKCVNDTNGVVDKYIGDSIMAEWGVPISKGNDTENAVNAALMMRTELIEFNKGRGGDKKPVIKIGSGINTGPVLAGQIGSEEKMEYTVIGDTVNLASRIEALNKPFATDILISEDSYNLVKDVFVVEKMSPITVKGKSEKQQIYAVLGRQDDPNSIKNIDELRKLLNIEIVDFKQEDLEQDEVKYEIHGS